MTRIHRILLALALAASVGLAGCLSGLAGLQGETPAAETSEGDDLQPGSLPDANPTNATNGTPKSDKAPPVARIRINAESGALVFETEFEALDQLDPPVAVDPGNLTFLASDSEALDGGRIEKYAWSVEPGGIAMEGRTAVIPLTQAGLYMVQLTVTDNRNATDTQMVHVAVLPKPYTVTETFTGSIMLGANGMALSGSNGAFPFKVLAANDAGTPLAVKGVKVTLAPKGTTARGTDLILTLTGAEGQVDRKNAVGAGGTETSTLATLPAGEYTAGAALYAGASAEYTLTVAITYEEVIEGLGGDGHAHAH